MPGSETKPKFPTGARVKIIAAKENAAAKKHAGKTGRITACKPSERPVAFLYDVVLDADEATLQLLPESCIEKT